MSSGGNLARRLGLGDAVAIGLGSMIGAGVFTAVVPAAAVAGSFLLVGLVLAAVVAIANATSSAQLAVQHPTSGGAYVYGREHLGPWAGFVAGWGFVVGKTASCAAMALTFAAYAAPPGWDRPVAVAAVVALTAVSCAGITRTAALTRAIVGAVLAVLALVVVAALVSGDPDPARLTDGTGPSGGPDGPGWYGTLQAAGLLFFAFAGYARIATLAEEVRDPARTIPRAVAIALGLTLVVYAVVATTLLVTLGPDRLASSTAPLAEAAAAGGWTWTSPVVRAGAAAASLGALLALVAGVGRTGLAMARHGDLPRPLAHVDPRVQVPRRAQVAVAVVVCALVVTTDLRGVIGFSSFGVLVYYLVANLAALRQRDGHRLYPRGLQVLGAAGCVVLAVTLPWPSVVAGAAVLGVGVAGRALRLRRVDPSAAG